MFCPNCSSAIAENSKVCPNCGYAIPEVAPAVKQKTKSKKLAALLMLFGLGDLYLCQWKKFFIKDVVVFMFTVGIGYLIWTFMDVVRILNGTINCDANGVPLV